MSALAQIRAAIVAKLGAVADIGKVHSYQRYAQRQGDLAALYVATIDGQDQLRGWHVRRVSTIEQDISATAGGRFVVQHTWRIEGFMALADGNASEETFDNLLEAVRDVFRADLTLGGVVSTTETADQAAVVLEEAAHALVGGILCHTARFSLKTIHYQ